MTRVAIVTDSTGDLAPDVAAAAGITVVPVTITLGAQAIREPAAIGPSGERTLGRDARAGAEPALIEAFAQTFAALRESHDAIVALLLSSRLGGSVAAAQRARLRLGGTLPIEIVDSRSASLGLGFQALRAADLARRGAPAGAMASELRTGRSRYHVIFSVESVAHLRQSGRIGRSAAMIAEALQLKPLLRIDEGQIVPYERARTRGRAMAELSEFVCQLPAVERVAVLYATNQDDAGQLAAIIAAETGMPRERLLVAPIGEAIAAQVGPGALGVAVVEPESR